MADSKFDYSGIPVGFYDTIMRSGSPVRRLWHLSKFERVLDCLPVGDNLSLLDIGCFAGSFLSMVPRERFARQLGVDILPAQIEYATAHYGTEFRRFRHLGGIEGLDGLEETFDCVTLIEVIEHLTREEAGHLLGQIARRLKPGGQLVLTTPNYVSAWPLIEFLLNRLSTVKYEEQHITKFDFFRLERQLRRIYPAFPTEFRMVLKTTSHFLTPFLAGISFELAHRLSRAVSHRHWHLPFGNLVLLVATRTGRTGGGEVAGRR